MSTLESPALSILNNKWIIKYEYPSDIFEKILDLRKMSTEELKGSYDDLDNLTQLKNLQIAVREIVKFKGKKICIYADYDVDGLSGAAILYRTLKALGFDVICYIPKREEGYGLNTEVIKKLSQDGIKLIITVDCGIKNEAEVKTAQACGMHVIVTDHHKIIGSVPECIIVHSDLTNMETSSFLSGGGVAFMLAKELLHGSPQTKWLLDLAAMSTFADMVPLVGANRIICKFGLIVLNQTKNMGLQELIKISNINYGDISAYHVSFLLAPKINASGRLEDPAVSLELLTTEDATIAKQTALVLDELNRKRQDLVSEHIDSLIEKYKTKKLSREAIIEFDPVFRDGVLGLVSGKLTERYYLPSIVLTSHDGILKGSARSIKGIDITLVLSKLNKYLINFGGHAMAAGLSLKENDLEIFTKKINEEIIKFKEDIFLKKLEIDALVGMDQLSIGLIDQLDCLEPFGIANPRPVFAVFDVAISSTRDCGKDGAHQQVKFNSLGKEIEGIMFNANKSGKFKEGERYDVAFNLQKDNFRNVTKLKMMIKDFRSK